MRAVIEVSDGGGMVVELDNAAKEALGGAVVQFFGLVQGMTDSLDRIARLPVVPLRFVGAKKKGARRAKKARA